MEPVRITVEIDCAEPLHGTVDEPGQPLRMFSGWAAFATVLDAVVKRAGNPDDKADCVL